MKSGEDFFTKKKVQLGVSLNDVQKKAVLHTNGPLLLLASPGSGKTTTTIMRIGYLIEEVGIQPSRIKAVTFSRASASDMMQRFTRFFPDQPIVDFSTIHSLAFEVVREYLYNRNISYHLIEGNNDINQKSNTNHPPHKKLLLRQLYKKMNGENITEDQLEELSTFISFIKNKLIHKDKWNTVKSNIPSAIEIIEEYERFKKNNPNQLLLDYDDMLTLANEAFLHDDGILRKYQQRYDFILTDESQDTSLVQHSIIEKLVHHHNNLFVVADDDQSIYSWRGAEPQYLIDFKKVYPEAVILKMEQNYRSSKDIVEVTNKFIKRNKERYNKNMFTENPPYKPIAIKSFEDYREQAKYIVNEITTNMNNLNDVAVLYRNNSSSIMIMNEFDRMQIPFYMKDFDNRFFSHWIVKDVLNFMRMSFTDKRFDLFKQIYNKFEFYISKEQLFQLNRANPTSSIFDQLMAMKNFKDYQIKQIKDCKKTLKEMKGVTPLKAIKMIRNQLGYDKTIKDMSKRLGFNNDFLIGVLHTLEEIADTLDTMEQFAERLNHLESKVKASKFNKNKNAATFSTFHSSKGLEFKKVYMIDLIEGVIPSHDEINLKGEGNSKHMEEAVRLFYVGMTRAEAELNLLTYKTQYGKTVRQSQFVTNVKNILSPPSIYSRDEPKKNIENGIVPYNPNAIKRIEDIHLGRTIKHRVFGHGEIANVTEDKIEIKFKKESKVLLLKTCIDMGLLEPVE